MNLTKSISTMKETQSPCQTSFRPIQPIDEKDFNLFLPAVVSGTNAQGNEFIEKTELSSMSSLKAHFGLRANVTIGTKLHVVLNIPRTLILENHLKLHISGEVFFAKADLDPKSKHLISIELDKTYKIHPIKN
ncbi:hypothetical protein ACFLRW_02590 [Acidobacteriota bacterium]